MVFHQYFQLAAVIMTGAFAYMDWRTGRIYRGIPLIPLVVAPFAHAIAYGATFGWGQAHWGFLYSLLGAAACAAVPLVLYNISFDVPASSVEGGDLDDDEDDDDEPLRAIYEVDILLLAAIGGLCMVTLGVEIELYAFVIAAIIAAGQKVFAGRLVATLGNALALATNPFRSESRRVVPAAENLTLMRFGPAAFIGTLLGVLLNWRF